MNSDEWCTPSAVLEPLYQFFGGPPDLDPAGNPRSIVGARLEWRVGSLQRVWYAGDVRTCFVNPPYSRLELWAPKMADEHEQAMEGTLIRTRRPMNAPEMVGLLPVATGTQWWKHVCRADDLMFTRRLTFIGDKHFTARFDSVLLYFGPRGEEFRSTFDELARWCVTGEDARRFFKKRKSVRAA